MHPPCPWPHQYRRQSDHFVPSSTPFLARFGLEALATVRVEEDTGTVPRSVTGSPAFGRNGLSPSNGRLATARSHILTDLRDTRAQGRPGAGWHPWSACSKKARGRTTGTSRIIRPSLRNGLTAYTRSPR